MALTKQSITFNFSGGLDTFQDVNQLPIGKFVSLQNGVFTSTGQGFEKLQKRNGFNTQLQSLDASATYLTTFGGNLLAFGESSLMSFSQSSNTWVNKGNNVVGSNTFQCVQLNNVRSVIRNYANQVQSDIAISSGSNLACLVYSEITTSVGSGSAAFSIASGSTVSYKYTVYDVTTGEQFILPTQISATGGGINLYPPKTFTIGSNFIVMFDSSVSLGSSSLQYFTINKSTLAVSGVSTFIPSYLPLSYFGSFDGVVASNTLFVGCGMSTNGGNSQNGVLSALSQTLVNLGSLSFGILGFSSGHQSIYTVGLCNDVSANTIWMAFSTASGSGLQSSAATDGLSAAAFKYTLASGSMLAYQVLVGSASAGTFKNVTCAANNQTCYVFSDTLGSFTSNISNSTTGYTRYYGITQSGVVQPTPYKDGGAFFNPTSQSTGLASKAFVIGSQFYYWSVFYSTGYQNTYFLLNGLTRNPIARLAYGNGTPFCFNGIPSANVIGSSVSFSYLFQDQLYPPSKLTNVGSTTQIAGVYLQTGINSAVTSFAQTPTTLETAGSLQSTGGLLWMYDGSFPVENNFLIYPDIVGLASGNVSGHPTLLSPQNYFYVATYEWIDGAGRLHRSAPSVPQPITVSSGGGVVIVRVSGVPVTNKNNPANLPKIVIYRWSQAQQNYYQVTSIINPTGQSVSNIQVTDSTPDGDILGNSILYTTGGVLEDSSGPATGALATFDNRLWLIDAEDPNTLWFSKTILEGTPVEMSDLQTFYVPPTTVAGSLTGPVTALAPMDDKLILFKNNTIYYINGMGPDITGANSQYSNPIFVVAGVGCINQNSIILTPTGLMFQSNNKGIWILKRDLTVEYIGKDVDLYQTQTVLSAVLVPGTNQVRFSLNNGLTLMYDYLVSQWGIFNGISNISSTLYQNLHTFINSSGGIYQESPGVYSDGGVATVMQFQTGFVNLAGLQGYKRLYWGDVLGTFQSGHTYNMSIAYDYNAAVIHTATIVPSNVIGSGSQVEQWQISFARPQCQSFQLTFQEVASGSAGLGLSLSGVDLTYGSKKGWPRNIAPSNRTG